MLYRYILLSVQCADTLSFGNCAQDYHLPAVMTSYFGELFRPPFS